MVNIVALKAEGESQWPKLSNRDDLSHNDLLSILSYDPDTGKFTWLQRVSIRVAAVGAEAGSKTPDGYVEIGVFGFNYRAHRLAWFYMTGEWPAGQIDHKNTDRADNKWLNLREATHGQNVHNSGLRKNNTSGFKGVSFVKCKSKWTARIMSERRLHVLGYFNSPGEAHEVYVRAASNLHGEFARVA